MPQLDLFEECAIPSKPARGTQELERSESSCLAVLVANSAAHVSVHMRTKRQRWELLAICALAGCSDCRKTLGMVTRT